LCRRYFLCNEAAPKALATPSVTAVGSVQAALDMLGQKDRNFDLMLTDIVMPGGNGRELAKAAAKLRPGRACS
jgi:CheY-like chemotaxis protein